MEQGPTDSSVRETELLPHCQKLDSGLNVPSFIDVEWIKRMKDEVKPRPDDIWIVTYPKSGTTWTQQIVRLILNRGKNDGKLLSEVIPFVEGVNPKLPGYNKPLNLDEMASPRAFKSHFPYDQMPCGPLNTTQGKYIYVVRNPKDVFVSLHIHVSAIPFLVKRSGMTILSSFCKERSLMEATSTTSSAGGLIKMTTMCSFSSTRT